MRGEAGLPRRVTPIGGPGTRGLERAGRHQDNHHDGSAEVMEEFANESGLRSGFESPGLDRPGRLPHQQGLCEARLGYRDGPGHPGKSQEFLKGGRVCVVNFPPAAYCVLSVLQHQNHDDESG